MKSQTESGIPEQENLDTDHGESGTPDALRVSFMLLVLGYALFITYFPIRFTNLTPASDIDHFTVLLIGAVYVALLYVYKMA
jgi:hypothetical protein